MDRIETVRNIVDGVLLNMKDDEERRCAYVHLHDIYSYANMDPNDHVHKGVGIKVL